MIYSWFIIAALVVALVFLLLFFYTMKSANELTRRECNNCALYDRTLHVCWPRFEERYPGDGACDLMRPRDKDEFENT